jgi:hypothetical protein
MLKGDLITQPFSCVLEAEKHRCINGGGACDISQDGTSGFSAAHIGSLTNGPDRLLSCQRHVCPRRRHHIRHVHPTAGAEAAVIAYARLADF